MPKTTFKTARWLCNLIITTIYSYWYDHNYMNMLKMI